MKPVALRNDEIFELISKGKPVFVIPLICGRICTESRYHGMGLIKSVMNATGVAFKIRKPGSNEWWMLEDNYMESGDDFGFVAFAVDEDSEPWDELDIIAELAMGGIVDGLLFKR